MRRAVLVCLLLAACGDRQALTPRMGAALPVKPATAPVQPQPADLLAHAPAQRPARSDELLVRSQERRDDAFNLPPR